MPNKDLYIVGQNKNPNMGRRDGCKVDKERVWAIGEARTRDTGGDRCSKDRDKGRIWLDSSWDMAIEFEKRGSSEINQPISGGEMWPRVEGYTACNYNWEFPPLERATGMGRSLGRIIVLELVKPAQDRGSLPVSTTEEKTKISEFEKQLSNENEVLEKMTAELNEFKAKIERLDRSFPFTAKKK